jgi:hypothetical protein
MAEPVNKPGVEHVLKDGQFSHRQIISPLWILAYCSRHSGAGRNPENAGSCGEFWTPASAGVTKKMPGRGKRQIESNFHIKKTMGKPS